MSKQNSTCKRTLTIIIALLTEMLRFDFLMILAVPSRSFSQKAKEYFSLNDCRMKATPVRTSTSNLDRRKTLQDARRKTTMDLGNNGWQEKPLSSDHALTSGTAHDYTGSISE